MALSTNQAALLSRLSAAPGPVSLEKIATWEIAHGQEYGLNAARSAMSRMEKRGLVVGSGPTGRGRSFVITPGGRAELSEGVVVDEPPEDAPDEPSGRWSTTYVVLERLELEGQEAFVVRWSGEARHTEHALRQAARDNFEDVDVDTTLVAVTARGWQPQPVAVRNRKQVSIG